MSSADIVTHFIGEQTEAGKPSCLRSKQLQVVKVDSWTLNLCS